METRSEVLMEVHVLSAEEVSKGAGDHVAAEGGNIPCKDLVLVAVKGSESVLAERNILPAMEDDQVEIEKCAAMLHSLPAPGDGDGDGKALGADKNGTLMSASQAEIACKEVTPEIVVAKEQEGCVGNGDGDGKALGADKNGTLMSASQAEIACKEMTPEFVVAKEQEGCVGHGDGDGDGKAPVSNETSLPEFLPVVEDNEPAWGDVPDDIPVEPILPPRPQRPRVAPECVEVDDVVQTMRNILFNLTYADDAHLSPEDETKVRDLLEYHPKAEEKTGSGIDFIKIKRHSTFKDVRCFWVVRTDGTETDFSFHKCLKGKVARENPSFLDRYDAIYRAPKRPRMV